jgi:hypothetical protein
VLVAQNVGIGIDYLPALTDITIDHGGRLLAAAGRMGVREQGIQRKSDPEYQ